jgi:DNA-binding NarL/FixJ family response regulator
LTEAHVTVQVLIVDDREVVRTELRHILELSGVITIAGEAVNGWDALRQARVLKPDVVLMDLEMPGLDGFEATRQLKANSHPPAVIMLSVYGDSANQQQALEAGADAFLVKGVDLPTMLAVIRRFSDCPPANGEISQEEMKPKP